MSDSTLCFSVCLAKSLSTAWDGWLVGVVTLLLLCDGFDGGETSSGLATGVVAIPDGPAPASSQVFCASALDTWIRGASPAYEESNSTSACCDCK